MILAFLTFFTGLAISAVAIYYSVLGLTSIFSAAALPIMAMGTILELSKLVAAWWLKANWGRAPFLLRTYMLTSVVVLMLITSMGIFGFLSKAHSDQAVPTGDVAAKIQIIDEKIAIQQEYIKQARKDIDVLNTQIDRYNELGAVSRGVKVREQQKAERDTLLAQIDKAQTAITTLREEKAPIAASMRAIEAEVGPIKYIAALIYGENPDANLLEKAVIWVIITIVFVFDPLAVLLLLSSQLSWQWYKQEKDMPASDLNAVDSFVEESAKVMLDDIEKSEVQGTGDRLRLGEELTDEEENINLSISEVKEPDIDSTLFSIEQATEPAPEPTVVEKIVEVEKVVEKIVEVPVDRVVEKIVEVPVPMDEFNRIMEINKTSGLEGLIAQKQKLLAKKDKEIADLKEQLTAKTLVPDTIQADDLGTVTNSGFGVEFPTQPTKGDTFLRVDYLPSKLHKWNGKKWIEVDKSINDGYAYNEEYIKHLAAQLKQGKYSIDDLSELEQEEVTKYLEGK